MAWNLDDERELWADACLKDFWVFCDYAMGYGTNPDFHWWTKRVHRPFCDWFQEHALNWLAHRGEEDKSWTSLLVVVMREFGKSMVITKAGLHWLHLHDPNISTYIGSSTVTRAQTFFEPIKVVFSGKDPHAAFTWLYGNWEDPNRSWSSDQIVHAARVNVARSEPSVSVWGIETGITGTHPDVGIIDDPIDYDLMAKDAKWLEKVNSHIASLTPVFKADALFIYVGTRYHNADAIGEALYGAGARTVSGMSMPEVVPRPDGRWHVYFMPGRGSDGIPIYPENWSETRLKNFEIQNPMMYAAQILQDPNKGSHVALTRAQIDQLWVDAKDVPKRLMVSIHLDTAFKSRESTARGDWSVIVVLGHTMDGTGEIYFLEGWGSNRWRVEDFNNQLVIVVQKLKQRGLWPFVLTDEAEIGGKYGAWELTLQNWFHAAGLPHPPIKVLNRGGKKKIARILNAVPFWVDRRVKLVRGAPRVSELVEQMLQIGTAPHDDFADAAADVFHNEIYAQTRIRGAQLDLQPRISRPWDMELQTGNISNEDARMLYDASIAQEEDERSPIE